jgi:orotidine-5'-phosphate decarboxylase
MDAGSHLAVPLDVHSLEEARPLAEALAGIAGWFKVGSELFSAAGPDALRMAGGHARVFLDIKLHDIPHQVARTVQAVTAHRVQLLTLHASGGSDMLRAARDAADDAATRLGCERPRLVAVTVLTSLGDADLKEIGVAASAEDQVARLADLAIEAGIDGVVASPREAAALRSRAPGLFLVTPGIRSAPAADDDQTRTATPGDAIRAGSDLLVVGRPILRAPDRAAAARAVVAEIETALHESRG